MVGTGRFELPTPRTPSECSTRLSHVPTLEGFHRTQARLRRFIPAEGFIWNFTLQVRLSKLLQISPVRSRADVDLQRYGQCVNFFHVLAD
jgi:hypothetical protein